MNEHPILFSSPMVKAILEGHKSQTRRVIKPQPPADATQIFYWWHDLFPKEQCTKSGCYYWCTRGLASIDCPYGEPGNHLWVREGWRFLGIDMNRNGRTHSIEDLVIEYRAGCGTQTKSVDWQVGEQLSQTEHLKWRASIHMPRWVSRLTLEIVNIRVQRVQEIDEGDAIAEGAPLDRVLGWGRVGMLSHKEGFMNLWDKINYKRGFGWESNPWVWVIEFKRVEEKAK